MRQIKTTNGHSEVERVEVGSFEIAPQLTVDFVGGETAIVFGAVFAKGY